MIANPSAIGSEIFSVIALLVISLAVLLILRHYLPLRTTPAYLTVPIFFALGIPASIILLVPIDLASSSRYEDASSRGIWLPDRLLLVAWRISYWLTFGLTWYIYSAVKTLKPISNEELGSSFLSSKNMPTPDTETRKGG